jgi:preprotein translocase subunit SecD
MREELKAGRTLTQAMNEGFRRAWLSIRDGHMTTLLGAIVLYLFTTSFVKGFALTLGIGVLVSLFSATIVTRSFLEFFNNPWFEKKKKLF